MKFEGPPGFQADVQAAGASRHARLTPSWVSRIPWTFTVLVVAPTLVTSIYYLFIAAPLYVSETRFVVRSKSEGQSSVSSPLLQNFGVSLGGSTMDASEVEQYMTSRDAVAELERAHNLRALLARPEGDFIARFPRPFAGRSFEDLFKGYKRFVTVGKDPLTGIELLEVRAFRAKDAQEMANALLDGGENLVNRLNDRNMADAVNQASRQVAEAEERGVQTQAALTAFRDRERLIDPDRSSQADLALLGKLEEQLASMRAERAGLAASAPESPQLPVLDRRITAFSAQLDAERSRTAGETDSLAPKVGEYERLVLDRDIAAKSIEAAMANLEGSRLEARRKQLYLERVVAPNIPDKAEQPKRLKAIFTVFMATLIAYGTLTLFIAGLREHRQQ